MALLSVHMTTIAFIEDDESFRGLLEAVFARHPAYRIAGSYASAMEARRGLSAQPADVILIDIRLPGDCGIATLQRLGAAHPHSRWVVLTNSDEEQHLFAALEAGAAGYLLKSDSNDQIVAAVDELRAGGVALSRQIARRLVGSFARPTVVRRGDVRVTDRESEILDELAAGRSSKEIAQKLGISTATVKNHLYRIYEKLGVRSRTEAVVRWLG